MINKADIERCSISAFLFNGPNMSSANTCHAFSLLLLQLIFKHITS